MSESRPLGRQSPETASTVDSPGADDRASTTAGDRGSDHRGRQPGQRLVQVGVSVQVGAAGPAAVSSDAAAGATGHRSPVRVAGAVGGGLAALGGAGVVAGVLIASLTAPLVVAAQTGAEAATVVVESMPDRLEPSPLPVGSTLRYADGSPMARVWSQNRVPVSLDAVAPVMRTAIVAIEDARFYEHGGADPTGIARAAVNNATGGDTQGASTLTQQWVRNVLLQQAREAGDEEAVAALTSADEIRKVQEIRLAVAVEREYSKDEILENYLNIALFGASNYGVEAASRFYFGHGAEELSLQDAALLAGMVQNPARFEPTQDPLDAQDRRDTVLGRMLTLGHIDQAEHDAAAAVAVPDQLAVTPVDNGCASAGPSAYFCDYAIATLLQDSALGATRDERVAALYRGGLDITTTLQPAHQGAAVTQVEDTVPYDDPSGVGAALVSVEPGTGRVVAMAQNRRHTTTPTQEAGYTSINYNVDEALGGGRGFQPGSTWKPFTLAAWLRNGGALDDTVRAAPERETYDTAGFTSCTGPLVGDWDVRNSEGTGEGRMTVEQATYDSVNTAYATMATQLDLCDIRDTAAALGAHPATGGTLADDPRSAYPSSILGTLEVAPLTMAAAYATFASGGTYCPPRPVETVVDRDGDVLPLTAASCTQPLATADHTSEEVANTITSALEHVFTRGTAARVGSPDGRPAAGKTGTTNDMVQTWFTGYTPELVTTAWVGQPDGTTTSLSDVTIDGTRGAVYGSTYAVPMWRDYMRQALDGRPATDFGPAPADLVNGTTDAPADATPVR